MDMYESGFVLRISQGMGIEGCHSQLRGGSESSGVEPAAGTYEVGWMKNRWVVLFSGNGLST